MTADRRSNLDDAAEGAGGSAGAGPQGAGSGPGIDAGGTDRAQTGRDTGVDPAGGATFPGGAGMGADVDSEERTEG